MRTAPLSFVTAFVVCAVTALAPAQEAPAPATRVEAATPSKPEKPIYDEQADAAQAVNAAIARAKVENRRVLIQWGANWCRWCKLLHQTFETDSDVRKELLYEYDLVPVDVGQFDKNAELRARYEAEIKGIPFLTVLDGDGKVVVNQETGSLEAGDKHDPAKVLAFLKQHAATPVKAEDQLSAALARGQQEHKPVLLRFGAPWCGWCHKMDAWQAQPEVARRIDASLVCVKVDIERAVGGQAMSEKFGATGGIPWFAILDGTGKPLVTSDGPHGNVGFPSKDEEIAHFESMLAQAVPGLSESDRAFLIESLKAFREADKAASAGNSR